MFKRTVIENNELVNSDVSLNRKSQHVPPDENIKRAYSPAEPVNHYGQNEKIYSPQMNPINNYNPGVYCTFLVKFLFYFFLAPQPQVTSPYHSNYYVQDLKYDRNMPRNEYVSSTYNGSNEP